MSNNLIVDKIKFAIKYEKPVKIYSKNGKAFWSDIYDFDGNQIKWHFANKNNVEDDLKLMNISNINDIDLNYDNNKEFLKYIKCKNNGIDDFESLEENLKRLYNYYKQILLSEIEILNEKNH